MALPPEFQGLDEPPTKKRGSVLADFDYSYDEFVALLDTAEGQASSKWEMDFVDQQRERFVDYGVTMFISPRQLEILEKLVHGNG